MTNSPFFVALNTEGFPNNNKSKNTLVPKIPSNKSNQQTPSEIKPSTIVKKQNFFEMIINFFKNLF